MMESLLRSHARLRSALQLAWKEVEDASNRDGNDRSSVVAVILDALMESAPIEDKADAYLAELKSLLELLSEDCDNASPIFDISVNRWVH